jgi:hypothetical protein
VELYGGTLANFADSMAEEIEKALNEVRVEAGLPDLPPGDRDRRILFIAIARGVIHHMKKHEAAFQVSVGVSAEHGHGASTVIQVKQA